MTTISAQIIADSINTAGKRLTTLQLCYPRFIHPEFMTHRALSRNASSSRAIPVERMIESIIENTAMPLYWGRNQKGMQAGEEIDELITNDHLVQSDKKTMWGFGEYLSNDDRQNIHLLGVGSDAISKEKAWYDARDYAVYQARAFHNAGYHKQIVNRLLEPFMHIKVVVSATEWANFIALRDHQDAEPHIAHLAREIKKAMENSTPDHLDAGEWHLPYVLPEDYDGYADELEMVKVSVARCARVSYLTHDGKKTTVKEDLDLYDRLVGSTPLHASPTEHQAEADVMVDGKWLTPEKHGNFVGWNQFRKSLSNENIT